eukprot:1195563-Prorocentrum_minimum.AAC.5
MHSTLSTKRCPALHLRYVCRVLGVKRTYRGTFLRPPFQPILQSGHLTSLTPPPATTNTAPRGSSRPEHRLHPRSPNSLLTVEVTLTRYTACGMVVGHHTASALSFYPRHYRTLTPTFQPTLLYHIPRACPFRKNCTCESTVNRTVLSEEYGSINRVISDQSEFESKESIGYFLPCEVFLDVARSRSDARPDFRFQVRPSEASLLGGDPPAGGPGKEAAQRQGM